MVDKSSFCKELDIKTGILTIPTLSVNLVICHNRLIKAHCFQCESSEFIKKDYVCILVRGKDLGPPCNIQGIGKWGVGRGDHCPFSRLSSSMRIFLTQLRMKYETWFFTELFDHFLRQLCHYLKA